MGKNRIIQVIFGLLDNAIKFTKHEDLHGDRPIDVLITVDWIPESDKDRKNNTEVIVNVKDYGIDIEPELFTKLFSKFVSKSFQGTGLGLFISKSIIEAHGGRFWAKITPCSRGATFSFSLPVVENNVCADTSCFMIER